MCGDVAAALVAASFLGLVAMELLDSVLRVGAVGGVALVVLVMGAAMSGEQPSHEP
jgi:glucose uptake protein GlcU